jgi:hypothetical protein
MDGDMLLLIPDFRLGFVDLEPGLLTFFRRLF